MPFLCPATPDLPPAGDVSHDSVSVSHEELGDADAHLADGDNTDFLEGFHY